MLAGCTSLSYGTRSRTSSAWRWSVLLFFSSRARLRDHSFGSFLCAGLFISLALLSSAFGATGLLLFGGGLLATCRTEAWRRNLVSVLGCGLLGYLAMCPFLPPSLVFTIRSNAALFPDTAWTGASPAAFIGVFAGCVLLWRVSRRWSRWYLRFFLLVAWVCAIIPVLYVKRDLSFLPQAARYKVEMELALSLLIVFGIAMVVDRLPKVARVVLAALLLWPAYQQVVFHRRFSKNVIQPVNITNTFEYHIAKWIDLNLPGWRVMAIGSVGQWLNAFSRTPQFGGGSFPTAPNPIQLRAATELDRVLFLLAGTKRMVSTLL